MKRLMAAAFALSLLSGAAANAQKQDDHHHGMSGGRQGSPAAAPAPAPRPGLGGRPGTGQGAAPSGPQYSHGNGPAFGPPARPQGQVAPQGYQGRSSGPPSQAFGPAPRNYPRGPGGGHEWNAGQRFRGPAYSFPRGYGYREWAFGQFLPGAFFGGDDVIADYWDYGLPTPPYGFEWVRVGADALLVRPVDGYILDVAHNLFW